MILVVVNDSMQVGNETWVVPDPAYRGQLSYGMTAVRMIQLSGIELADVGDFVREIEFYYVGGLPPKYSPMALHALEKMMRLREWQLRNIGETFYADTFHALRKRIEGLRLVSGKIVHMIE